MLHTTLAQAHSCIGDYFHIHPSPIWVSGFCQAKSTSPSQTSSSSRTHFFNGGGGDCLDPEGTRPLQLHCGASFYQWGHIPIDGDTFSSIMSWLSNLRIIQLLRLFTCWPQVLCVFEFSSVGQSEMYYLVGLPTLLHLEQIHMIVYISYCQMMISRSGIIRTLMCDIV